MLRVEKANKEMMKVCGLLVNDFECSKKVMRLLLKEKVGENEQPLFGIRTVIRTAAALIEGVVYQLRLVCLAASEDNPLLYSVEEILALKQENISIDNNGRIKVRVSFQQIQSSIAFTFLMFSKIHGKEITIDKSDNRWESFIAFINIRNGLMHPKFLDDLELVSNGSKAKNRECVEGVSWFIENHQRLLKECEGVNNSSDA